MKFYQFSPICTELELLKAIEHIHISSYILCKKTFGYYLPSAGNIGIFCHYESEYIFLTNLRKNLTKKTDNIDQKYFKLHSAITIPKQLDIPETTYSYLYIRKPDPYRHHVGDVDFYLQEDEYNLLKRSIIHGKKINGARIFDRQDLDMIELYDPDIDVLAYVSTQKMTDTVKVK